MEQPTAALPRRSAPAVANRSALAANSLKVD
jgi:hypothetical protein